jgi:hypothetical protein
MKPSDIQVGKVYRNRGKGTTQRKVTGIGVEFRPDRRWSPDKPDADAPGVEYQQKLPPNAPRQGFGDWSEPSRLWLDSFASWAGAEVPDQGT